MKYEQKCPGCGEMNRLFPVTTGQKGGYCRCGKCGKLYGWYEGDGREVLIPALLQGNETIFITEVKR